MYSVMIVDDFEILRRKIKRLSLWEDNNDFKIIAEAEDGNEALDKLREEPVDVLITDIRMPGMNGLELIEHVFVERLAKFTIFLSDHTEFSLAKEAMKFRLFDYLVKPVQENELEELLAKIKMELKREDQVRTQKSSLLPNHEVLSSVPPYLDSFLLYLPSAFLLGQKEEALMLSKRLFSDGLIYQQGNYETANLVVERFITTTVKAIKERAIWLDDFFRFPQFSITQGDGEKRYREKEQQMIAFIEEGTEVINELILRHDEGLIHEACLYTLLHVEKNIQLGQLASNLFVTKNHISNLFKRETGITLGQYISKVKVERAKILLSDSTLLTYEISLKLGYKDAEYFSKVFKKYTGITPTAYQAGDA